MHEENQSVQIDSGWSIATAINLSINNIDRLKLFGMLSAKWRFLYVKGIGWFII